MPHMLGLFCEKNMTIQTVNLGTAPSGAGGDTFRSTGAKINENFANWNHAASRYVGVNAGNVMEVGAYGLGGNAVGLGNIAATTQAENPNLATGFYLADDLIGGFIAIKHGYGTMLIGGSIYNGGVPTYAYYNSVRGNKVMNAAASHTFKTTQNTAIDSNGFIKAASPVVQLFADRIELNSEAKQQEVLFSKVGVGDYLIQGSTGLAQQGWYVETPKDAIGNALVAVVYEQLENQDISVKTYKKKFDIETASIVADLEQAIDIPAGRWIDIRLQELPEPEFVPPVSNTPPSFQPTGISQAVSEMMNDPEQ